MSEGPDKQLLPVANSRPFRFSLQWMLMAVAALSVGLAFCSQLFVVQQRRSFLNALRTNPRISDISLESDYVFGTERLEERGFSVPRIRRWLGDEGVLQITTAGPLSEGERERIKSILPEAVVTTGLPTGPGVGMF